MLAAIGEAAGHPISFQVATRERMVATSVSAANGDIGGFTRLIEEATDPRRVQAMTAAPGFLRKNFPPWNDTYIATTTTGQSYAGIVVSKNDTDVMVRVRAEPTDWIAIGNAADLPQRVATGQSVQFTASRLPASATTVSPSDNTDRSLRRSGPSAGM